ncbi:HIT family protein [Candidatus Uhrbacteria bacterium]|nr:HIT family protein [Candidatus Uhrbacteria bacterium]
MSDCLFCKIVAGAIPSQKIYEDEKTIAFLDIHPVNAGHTLVISKTHSDKFLEAELADMQNVLAVIHKITPAILKAVGADSANISTNNGRASGQIIFHTHWHVMPRLATDGYKLWHGKDGMDLPGIAEKIRKEIGV